VLHDEDHGPQEIRVQQLGRRNEQMALKRFHGGPRWLDGTISGGRIRPPIHR